MTMNYLDDEQLTAYGQHLASLRSSRKPRAKYHTLQSFNMKDVAYACGLSLRTYYRKLKQRSLTSTQVRAMQLSELVNLINSLRKEKERA